MLRVVCSDTLGEQHLLTRPLKLTIRMDEDVPADDLYAVFAYTPVGELTGVRVYDDERLVFVGVVDEQEEELSEKGRFLRISSRSLAAHLLDNEAPPQFYDHPSAALIYERHVRPYGIRRGEEDDATYYGELPVKKGASQWTALKDFCNVCFSSQPRVTADGILRMRGIGEPGRVVFSDLGDGISYSEISRMKKRCEEISRVNIKISDSEGYRYRIDNPDALARGVCRERYLNAVLAATPMTCADAMLSRADGKSFGIRLKCRGRLLDKMGWTATVKSRTLGVADDLTICGIAYRLDQNGETTVLQLKRRNNRCGYQDI